MTPDGGLRVKWSDERLDDFASSVRDRLTGVEAAIAQTRATELRELRERVSSAEVESASLREGQRADRKAAAQHDEEARYRRWGLVVAVGIPILSVCLGPIITLIVTHSL